ncbi:MAG: GyrI-like domain-containing protein [Planctomycetes bacterium]|nr:GyrI-like domain-containing protein [Planctomycetota bacterium]
MKPLLLVLVLGASPLQSKPASSRPSDEALPAAIPLLNRVDQARGDTAALGGVRTLLLKGELTMPGVDGKVQVVEAYAGPRSHRWTMNWSGMGEITYGACPEFAWSEDPAMGITIRTGAEAKPAERLGLIGSCALWTTAFVKAETLRSVIFNDRPHFEVRLTDSTGGSDVWVIDAERFTISRVDTRLPDPSGGDIPMEFVYADWKPVDGVLFPHKRIQKAGGYQMTTTFSEVKVNETLTDGLIAPPARVLAAFKDPSKRSKAAPNKRGECTMETVGAQPILSIRAKVLRKDISKHLAQVLPEIYHHIIKKDGKMVGPPLSRYHGSEGEIVDLEAGFPLKEKLASEGRIIASELPGGNCAVTWHVGPYDKLPASYAILEKWMEQQKLKASGGPWEVYWTDPGLEPDPTNWKTQILWPLQ